MASVPGPPDDAGAIVPEEPGSAPEARGITLELVREHPELSTFIAAADRVESAVRAVIAEGRSTTHDLGGSAGTREFAAAVAERVRGA